MPPQARDHQFQELSLMMGQVLEATKVGAEAIAKLQEEAGSQGRDLGILKDVMGRIEKHVGELDRVVRTGNGTALVVRMHTAVTELHNVREDIEDMRADINSFATAEDLNVVRDQTGKNTQDIKDLQLAERTYTGGNQVIMVAGNILAWVVTTALAIYAIVSSNSSSKH